MTEYAALTLHEDDDLTLGDLFARRSPPAEPTIIGTGEGTVYTLTGSAQPPGTMDCPVTVTAPRSFGEHAGQQIEVWTVLPDEHRVELAVRAEVEMETAVAGTTEVEIEVAGQAAVEVEVEAAGAVEAEPATAAQARVAPDFDAGMRGIDAVAAGRAAGEAPVEDRLVAEREAPPAHRVGIETGAGVGRAAVVDPAWQALLGNLAATAHEEPAADPARVRPGEPPAPAGGVSSVGMAPPEPAPGVDLAGVRSDEPAFASGVGEPAPGAGPEVDRRSQADAQPDAGGVPELAPEAEAEVDLAGAQPDEPTVVSSVAGARPDEPTVVSSVAGPAPEAALAADLAGAPPDQRAAGIDGAGGPGGDEVPAGALVAGFLEAHGVRLLKIAGGVTGVLVAIRRLGSGQGGRAR